MTWIQKQLELPDCARGFHLITAAVEAAIPEIQKFHIGMLHVYIQHTSASLTLNENADPDVQVATCLFAPVAHGKAYPGIPTGSQSSATPATAGRNDSDDCWEAPGGGGEVPSAQFFSVL